MGLDTITGAIRRKGDRARLAYRPGHILGYMRGYAPTSFDHQPWKKRVELGLLNSAVAWAQAITTLGLGQRYIASGPKKHGTGLQENPWWVCKVILCNSRTEPKHRRTERSRFRVSDWPKAPGRSDQSVGYGGNPPQKVYFDLMGLLSGNLHDSSGTIHPLPLRLGPRVGQDARGCVGWVGTLVAVELNQLEMAGNSHNGLIWKLEARETKKTTLQVAKAPLAETVGLRSHPIVSPSRRSLLCRD